MIFISVMYKDLKIKQVPIAKIDSLPKDGVLFIKLKTDTREGKLAGISMSHSLDNYAVLHKIEKKADWYMLTGWDDDQFIWRRECDDCENRKVVDFPVGTMHTIFRGFAVDAKHWEKAVKMFDKDM